MATTQPMADVNPKTEMTHTEMQEFVRDHFEEFVNRKNLEIGKVNFAPEFVDRGTDVPPGMPPGPEGAIAYVSGALKKFPDMHAPQSARPGRRPLERREGPLESGRYGLVLQGAAEAEGVGIFAEGVDAEGDVVVERDA
jgi:hypothetical protein